jgi:hypothetical protein
MARALPWTVAPVVLAVVLLRPVLKTGYFSDDIVNSLVDGVLRYHHLSLGELIALDITGWLRAGRFFPLMIVLVRGSFHLLPGLAAYKGYLVAAVAVNLLLFARLVRRLTQSPALAGLAVLAAAALFQLRAYHDPLLSFHGFMQFVLAATLLSLLALDRFLVGGSRLWLVAAVLCYLLALLTYEASYPFFLLHAALARARGHGWKTTALTTLPFAGAALACAAVPLVLRTVLGYPVPPAYRPNLDPLAFAGALGKQLLAAVPLSYFLSGPPDLFPPSAVMLRRFPAVLTVAAFALALTLLRRLRREQPQGGTVGARGLAVMGFLVWTLPALLVSTSPKYQGELLPGLGYLPVYVQYYGVALLLLAGASAVGRRLAGRPVLARAAGIAAALALALVTGQAHVANLAVAGNLTPFRTARENMEAALDGGLLAGVPDGATLLLTDDGYQLWHHGEQPLADGDLTASEYFCFLHSGKRVTTVVRPPDAEGSARPLPEGRGEVYEVRAVAVAGRGRAVLLVRRSPAGRG